MSRTSIFHLIFGWGKIFVQARAIAEETEGQMLVTSRPCVTRFSSLQLQEFTKLLKLFLVCIKKFLKYGYVELKEYQIAGQDFDHNEGDKGVACNRHHKRPGGRAR